MKGCDMLQLSRHMRDSVNHLTTHDLATSILGFKLLIECEKADYNFTRMTKHLIRKIISRHCTDTITPCISLCLERTFWCWDLIIFLLNSCCIIPGIITTMSWFPFTYDQHLKPCDKCTVIENISLLGTMCYKNRCFNFKQSF